tara:strand:+ start:9888 stop:10028 length:141 start_codon:yes stop_codon:yes gene_type:complete
MSDNNELTENNEDDGQQQLNDNEEQAWEKEEREYNLKLLNDLLKEL